MFGHPRGRLSRAAQLRAQAIDAIGTALRDDLREALRELSDAPSEALLAHREQHDVREGQYMVLRSDDGAFLEYVSGDAVGVARWPAGARSAAAIQFSDDADDLLKGLARAFFEEQVPARKPSPTLGFCERCRVFHFGDCPRGSP